MTTTTVGQAAYDLIIKDIQSPATHSAEEQMRECLTDWEKGVLDCLNQGLQKHTHDFYIVVITKAEKLLENVYRNFYFTRNSCPSPDWDQTAYRYHRKADHLEFLWVIPSKPACEYFMTYGMELPPEQYNLLRYVIDFSDGTLLRLAKKLNNEQADSPLLQS